MSTPTHEIDIYPVGVLADLQKFIHMPDRRAARYALRRAFRIPFLCAKGRDWRAFRNCFNGYLAEPRKLPTGLARCGSGWTRGRAYRSLQRHMQAASAKEYGHR